MTYTEELIASGVRPIARCEGFRLWGIPNRWVRPGLTGKEAAEALFGGCGEHGANVYVDDDNGGAVMAVHDRRLDVPGDIRNLGFRAEKGERRCRNNPTKRCLGDATIWTRSSQS